MTRVVIDTNCLPASTNPYGNYFRLYQLFIAQSFEWVLSTEILTEYEERITDPPLLGYPGGSGTQSPDACVQCVLSGNLFQMTVHHITDNPDDNKFVDVAIAANADYLVANDRRFQPLAQLEFLKAPLLSIRQFLAEFSNRKAPVAATRPRPGRHRPRRG